MAQSQFAVEDLPSSNALEVVWGKEQYAEAGDILIYLSSSYDDEEFKIEVTDRVKVYAKDNRGVLYALNTLQKHFRLANDTAIKVFYYTQSKRYFSAMAFYLRLILKNFWQAMVSFLPGVLCLIGASLSAGGKVQLAFSDIIWYYIGYSLVFVGIIFFSYLTEDSFLAIYYYIDNKSNYTNQIFAYSEINMTRCRKSYAKLQLSLLPTMLSCILVIPCLFAIPFITVTQATSAKWIIALSDKYEV